MSQSEKPFGRASEKHELFTQDARKDRTMRAIERFVLKSKILEAQGANADTIKEIELSLKDMSSEEKAIKLYENFVTYNLEQKPDNNDQTEEEIFLDPYFVSQFSSLWNDKQVRKIFLEKYGEARTDIKVFRLSDLGSQLKKIQKNIITTSDICAELQQALNLNRVKRPTEIKATQAKLAYHLRRKEQLLHDAEKLINLKEYEHTQENTDVAALEMYETIGRYQEEAERGFVWLPSRLDLHQKIIDVMEHTGKAPLLLGPPGTGKTTQLGAVAKERTGKEAIRIPCSPGLSEEGLLYIRDVEAGSGVYDYKGTLAEAATGYTDSKATAPSVDQGRFGFLDEISQLNLDRALAPIKDTRQAKTGKNFSRFVQRPVLAGFELGATSNVPISDERLDREFARIPTDYFSMTKENPELFDFMLAFLRKKEGNFPALVIEDLKPAYERHDFSETERKILKDGSIAVAEDKLIEDPTDSKHGFLFRFAHMIRAVEDSYIHGSQFNEKHLANTAMYEDYDADRRLIIKGYVRDLRNDTTTPGGTMLKLKSGSSTITAEMVSRWVKGFTKNEEQDLSVWLQQMFQEHIDQSNPEDAERIKAIANHFHIFDEVPKDRPREVLTPKQIGYLSPRVPRPLYVEAPPKTVDNPDESEILTEKPPELYTAVEIILDSGKTVRIRKGEHSLRTKVSPELLVGAKTRFMVKGSEYFFAGTLEDNKEPVGSLLAEPDLYTIFTPEQVERGITDYSFQKLEKDVKELCKMTQM